jgi:hypothetical protein
VKDVRAAEQHLRVGAKVFLANRAGKGTVAARARRGVRRRPLLGRQHGVALCLEQQLCRTQCFVLVLCALLLLLSRHRASVRRNAPTGRCQCKHVLRAQALLQRSAQIRAALAASLLASAIVAGTLSLLPRLLLLLLPLLLLLLRLLPRTITTSVLTTGELLMLLLQLLLLPLQWVRAMRCCCCCFALCCCCSEQQLSCCRRAATAFAASR